MKIWFPAIKGNSGADVYTRRLADALRCRGIETKITWFPTYLQFVPFLLRNTSPPRGTHIIHANSWSGFAFKQTGIPLIITEHHCVFDPNYRPYKSRAQHLYHEFMIRPFEIASFQSASAITADSHFTASSLARTLNIRTAQVIHNWIDTGSYVPLEQNTDSRQRPFRLLFAGNLSRRKGADLLAPIMKELGTKFELHFTSGLKNSKMAHVTQNMAPLGQLAEERELIKAYCKCDALLFPSRFEGFGYVALEAMACGKPVIATNSSSLPEVVEEGVTGILCPPDDISAFVAACRKLANNPEILLKFGKAARHRAENLFSENLIIPQYIELYEKIVNEIGC